MFANVVGGHDTQFIVLLSEAEQSPIYRAALTHYVVGGHATQFIVLLSEVEQSPIYRAALTHYVVGHSIHCFVK